MERDTIPLRFRFPYFYRISCYWYGINYSGEMGGLDGNLLMKLQFVDNNNNNSMNRKKDRKNPIRSLTKIAQL